jgi:hypothetical protein
MLSRLSLRTRLILGVILLAGIGIVAADAATYTQLRSFLLQRVDNTLTASHPGSRPPRSRRRSARSRAATVTSVGYSARSAVTASKSGAWPGSS